jgi:hypothetical protein
MGKYSTASGDYSTAIGSFVTSPSGFETVVGSYNTTYAPLSTTNWNESDRLFVIGNGYNSLGVDYRSNALTILKNGKVGIGNSNPVDYLHISAQSENNGITIDELDWTKWAHIRFREGGSNLYGASIDYNAAIDQLIIWATDNGASRVGISVSRASANVGIGTSPSESYKLYVLGSAYSTGGWSGSDARWKKDIVPIESELGRILQLKGVYFSWKIDEFPEMNFDQGRQIGLIAQEMEKIFPELVKTDNNGYKAIAYDKLTVILTKAVQEQQQQIESYKSENDNLKSQLQSLQEEVDQIKTLLTTSGGK